jgi:dipeptidyl aminopeptidase/acylaminoacyl peptidase
LDAVVANWRPRFVANELDPMDVERTLASIDDWSQWAPAWTAEGERYDELARAALDQGHAVTAGIHWRRAALTFHFAQFVVHGDEALRTRIHRRQCDVYRSAAPLLQPPSEAVWVEHEGLRMPGYLRLPTHVAEPPLVVLIAGLESTKEQFTTFEPFLLEREMATLSIEGPGQGESWHQQPWSDEGWLEAFGSVLEFARALDRIDNGRIALLGTSFGGYLALKAAVRYDVAPVVDIAGPYDFSDFDDLQPVTRESFARFAGASTEAAARNAATKVSLAGSLQALRGPALIVHGDEDRIIPPRNALRIATDLADRGRLWMRAGGNHSLNNQHTVVRPAIADWLADELDGTGA